MIPPCGNRKIARFPPGVHAFFRAANNFPRPVFTCPECRRMVTHRPSRVFIFTHVIRWLDKAMGKEQLTPEGKEGGSNSTNIWDAFFGTQLSD